MYGKVSEPPESVLQEVKSGLTTSSKIQTYSTRFTDWIDGKLEGLNGDIPCRSQFHINQVWHTSIDTS